MGGEDRRGACRGFARPGGPVSRVLALGLGWGWQPFAWTGSQERLLRCRSGIVVMENLTATASARDQDASSGSRRGSQAGTTLQPGSPEGSGGTSPARLKLAAALRDLGHSLVAHQPPDELLERITAAIGELLPEIERAPERPHAFLQSPPTFFQGEVPQGPPKEPGDVFPDCVVSGRANPMGIAARLWREGDEAVCQVTLGPAFEGAPGRAHGGVVAALLDEAMGLALSISGSPGFTGRLAVTYRAPTPLGVPLEARSRLTARDGRKLTISAELRADGELLAQAEGLFISVDTDQFLAAGRG